MGGMAPVDPNKPPGADDLEIDEETLKVIMLW